MKVIIHVIDVEASVNVRLIVKSIKKKTLPRMWTRYKYIYFCNSKEFQIQKFRLLDYQIEELYEATHDVPDCDACELVEEPINYRRAEMEDRD